jgi:hypothetical protein
MRRPAAWLRAHPTVFSAAACLALVVIVVAVAASLDSRRLLSVEAATTEAMSGIELLSSQLPASAVLSSTDIRASSDCPDGSGGSEVSIVRTLALRPAFDLSTWTATLATDFESRGWHVNATSLDEREHRRVTFVNEALLVYTIVVSPRSEAANVIIRTVSRCSEA